MSENPYRSPKAEIEIESEELSKQYYVVSIKKFTVLFFSTFGLYAVYWFYKNWQEHKVYNNTNIWPVARGIFSIFFAHSLFQEIKNTLSRNCKEFEWNPAGLATAYVIFTIVGRALDNMAMKETGSPYTDVASLMILPLIYVTLLKPQKAINLSQSDPEGFRNSTFTVANIVWVALGLIFWLLTMLGILMLFGVADA